MQSLGESLFISWADEYVVSPLVRPCSQSLVGFDCDFHIEEKEKRVVLSLGINKSLIFEVGPAVQAHLTVSFQLIVK